MVQRGGGPEFPIGYEIIELVEPELIVLRSDPMPDMGMHEPTVMRVEFHDHGEKTRMALSDGPYPPESGTRRGRVDRRLRQAREVRRRLDARFGGRHVCDGRAELVAAKPGTASVRQSVSTKTDPLAPPSACQRHPALLPLARRRSGMGDGYRRARFEPTRRLSTPNGFRDRATGTLFRLHERDSHGYRPGARQNARSSLLAAQLLGRRRA